METMQKVQRGFTLIELMIVVAIIGILAALAIPAYQDYTIKSRVGEGASLTGAFKTAIEIYWSENGTLNGVPTDLTSVTLGLASVSGEYVSSISINTVANRPTLEVELMNTTKLGDASGDCFTYTPTPTSGTGSNLRWTITAACPGAGGTGVENKYLPKT